MRTNLGVSQAPVPTTMAGIQPPAPMMWKCRLLGKVVPTGEAKSLRASLHQPPKTYNGSCGLCEDAGNSCARFPAQQF